MKAAHMSLKLFVLTRRTDNSLFILVFSVLICLPIEGDQVITADDLVNFKVTERAPIVGKLGNGNYTMISVPPPSGGAVLQYIMKILDGKWYSLTSCLI